MHGGKMTEMEKLHLKNQLSIEELCAKKVRVYQGQVQDPALQNILQQRAEQSQKHISALRGMLQEVGMPM